MKIFTNEQIRSIDRYTIENEGVTSLELVERAATAIACELISRWRPSHRICIFAGPGNNGADALAVGRMLIEQGYNVEIFLFNIFGKLSDECAYNRKRLLEIDNADFTEVVGGNFQPPDLSSDVVVLDGLFGSGLREPLTGGFQSLVSYINASEAYVVSIDVPSGLFGEWNENVLSRNVVHADLTLAIQFPRLAFFIVDNAEFIGEWKVLDIELSQQEIKSSPYDYFLVEKSDARNMLRPRGLFTSKADFGNALLVAGSYGMMGAAVMGARAALRSGVGKLTVHSARCGYNIIQTSVPEALFQADHHDIAITDITLKHDYNAVAIGPGIGTHDVTRKALESFIISHSSGKPLLLDADALNCISQRRHLLDALPPLSIITPHAGEFDRLFGEHNTAEERLKTAIEQSAYYQIIILLKGRYTAVVRPDGKIYFNSSGNPGLATPGSGDVLTGIIASFMAQGYIPAVAATLGAFVHGYAGDIAAERHGRYGVLASDVAECTGRAIRDIMQ